MDSCGVSDSYVAEGEGKVNCRATAVTDGRTGYSMSVRACNDGHSLKVKVVPNHITGTILVYVNGRQYRYHQVGKWEAFPANGDTKVKVVWKYRDRYNKSYTLQVTWMLPAPAQTLSPKLLLNKTLKRDILSRQSAVEKKPLPTPKTPKADTPWKLVLAGVIILVLLRRR